MKIGVIVGRFQVDELHAGHRYIIKKALKECDSVICFIGSSVLKADKYQPLDVETRIMMLNDCYPSVRCFELPDMKLDSQWSENLDREIKNIANVEDDIVLYSGRDGFAQYYTGEYPIEEVYGPCKMSGVLIREVIGSKTLPSVDFRRGIIYSTQNKYNTVYPVIDCAIYNDKNQVLLIHKKSDGAGIWRFMGGFFDVKQDQCLEMTVRREAKEECGDIEIGDIKYIASYIVDDWRYKRSPDKILTSFFKAKYVYGQVKAGDDADDVRWVSITDTEINIVEGHKPMWLKLKEDFFNERG